MMGLLEDNGIKVKIWTDDLFQMVIICPQRKAPSSHLEPDILECEVKWALRSITVMEFQLSYFKS